MKTFIIISALILLFSCKEDDVDPHAGIGCQTGIPKNGDGQRVLIRCATYEQYIAGNNTNAGGIPASSDYTEQQWAKCSECK